MKTNIGYSNGLQLLVILALWLSASSSTSAATYSASGTLTVTEFVNDRAIEPSLSRRFTIDVDAPKWYLKIESTGVADQRLFGQYEGSFDGAKTSETVKFKLLSPGSQNPLQGAPLAGPAIHDRGFISYNSSPWIGADLETSSGNFAVWLAFSGSSLISNAPAGRLPVVWEDGVLRKYRVSLPVKYTQNGQGFLQSVEWLNDGLIRAEITNHLVTVAYPEPYQNGFLNARFNTESTNFSGMELPKSFVFTQYTIWFPVPPTNGVARRMEVRGTVDEYHSQAPRAGLTLLTSAITLVSDARFDSNAPISLRENLVEKIGVPITDYTNQLQVNFAASASGRIQKFLKTTFNYDSNLTVQYSWQSMVLFLAVTGGLVLGFFYYRRWQSRNKSESPNLRCPKVSRKDEGSNQKPDL